MKHLITICALLVVLHAECQLTAPFALLDSTFLQTEFLSNQSPGLISLKSRNGISAESSTPGQGKQLVLEMLESQFSDPAFTNLSELRANTTERLVQEHAVPLIILDFNYESLLPWAIDSGFVDTAGGYFQHLLPDVNPFYQEELFAAFTFQSKLPVEGARILLTEEFFFSNKEQPDLKEIQLQDGQGFIPFEWGDVLDLPPTLEEYKIQLKFTSELVKRKASSRILAMSCTSNIFPDLPPWPSVDAYFPWKIQSTWNDELVEASAYVKFGNESQNGLFTKPFIFVEGIDFNTTDQYPMSHGDFGWCQFSSGTDPNYSFLYNAPTMIDELLNNGYDVILLDFTDGADYVQKNSAVLIELIHLVNEYKEGEEPNVVSGASMGGQITRYALRKMELQHDPHCTRLWISMDSPHRGAHIPLSIQQLLFFLAHPQNPSSGQAVVKLSSTLYRPAARQFLLQQLPSANSMSNEYYQMMDGMGYPKMLRKIGIANGSGHGLTQELTTAPLINYNVIAFGEPKAWLRAYPAPGQGSEHLFFSGRIPSSTFQLPDWLGGACIPMSYFGQAFQTTTEYQGLEFCPGGTRPTILEMVQEINQTLSSGDCDADLIDEYQNSHSFIPTLSALGLSMEDPFANAEDVLDLPETTTPFDEVLFSDGNNQIHSEITDEILAFVLDQVSSGENQLPPQLSNESPNNGVFNAGRSEFSFLRSLEIYNGGKLFLNAQIPNYFAQIPDEFPENGSHIDFFTSSCGSSLIVNLGGELHIGSHDGSSTASLTIVKGSTLSLISSGKIIVHRGSKLIIEDGAFFYQTKGRIDVMEGAVVEIEPLAEVYLSGPSVWNLQREGGQFILSSDLRFNSGSILTINGSSQTGTLIINNEIDLIGDGQCQLRIYGENSESPLLSIAEGGLLNVDIGFNLVRLKGVIAEVHSGLCFSSQARVICEKLYLTCPFIEGAELEIFNKAVIQDSRIEQVQFRVDQSDIEPGLVSVINSEFHGRKALLRIHRGKFNVSNSEFFGHAQLRSSDLNGDSFIKHCYFEGDGPDVPYELYDTFMEAVLDASTIELTVSGTEIRNYRGAGIRKDYGELNLSCCSFYSNHTGVVGTNDASLYLDGVSGNGGNLFRNNRNNIEILGVQELKLKNGANSFLPALELNFKGYFNRSCVCSTHAFLDALGNTWSLFQPESEPVQEDFQLSYIANCEENPWQDACPIPVFDDDPSELDCPFKPDRDLPNQKAASVEELVLIYPNPSDGDVKIRMSASGDIVVYDVLGSIVAGPLRVEGGGVQTLDLKDLPDGIYFVTAHSSGTGEIQKLIIQD